MKKKYYVYYYKDFSNTYILRYAETDADEKAIAAIANAERITRNEAEKLAAAENSRRKHDTMFSGYADNAIYPAAEAEEADFKNSQHHQQRGYIWKRT